MLQLPAGAQEVRLGSQAAALVRPAVTDKAELAQMIHAMTWGPAVVAAEATTAVVVAEATVSPQARLGAEAEAVVQASCPAEWGVQWDRLAMAQ